MIPTETDFPSHIVPPVMKRNRRPCTVHHPGRTTYQSLINIKSKWVEFLADSFDYAGLGNVWRAQGERYSAAWIMNTVKIRISDMSIQE